MGRVQTQLRRRSSARAASGLTQAAGDPLPRHGNPLRAGDAMVKGLQLSAVASPLRWRLLRALDGAPGAVVVTGADGFVIDVFCTEAGAAMRAEMGLTVGVDLSLASAGPNAVALALAERRAAMVYGRQHGRPVLHPYAGAAEPLVVGGRLVGALGLFVPKERFVSCLPGVLAAAARSAEEQLQKEHAWTLHNWLVLLEWRRFLAGGAPFGVVNPEILASWARSREWGIEPDRFAFGAPKGSAGGERRRPERELLVEVAAPFVRRLGAGWSGGPCAVLLTDPEGVILDLYTTLDSRARRALNLYPGFSCHERFCGTNGWGTPLVAGRAMCVVGAENYAWSAKEWACAGSPIAGPDGRPIGGLSIGVPFPSFESALFTLLISCVGTIERCLRARLLDSRVALGEEAGGDARDGGVS